MIKIETADLNKEEIAIFFESKEVRLLRYYEPAPGIFLAESLKVIKRAIDAGYEPISYLFYEGAASYEDMDYIETLDGRYPVYSLSKEVLSQITGFNLATGLVCAMRRRKLPDLAEALKDVSLIAYLDNVENPTNVGAIFRSAAALGIEEIVVGNGSADPLYRRAGRVSMGTVFQIPWTKSSYVNYIDELKKLRFTTIAMALKEDSVELTHECIKSAKKLCIILGNEGEGLKQEIIDACDYTVMIPMHHGVDSLNVSNAAAIAFYELGKR